MIERWIKIGSAFAEKEKGKHVGVLFFLTHSLFGHLIRWRNTKDILYSRIKEKYIWFRWKIIFAVVSEQYEVNVYHSHVIAGNTAVLTCVIPPVVKEHVTVTSWSRDESILLPGPNMGKFKLNWYSILRLMRSL